MRHFEKSLISGILSNPHMMWVALSATSFDEFRDAELSVVFAAMEEIYGDGKEPNLHELSDYLNENKLLDTIGGPTALAEIADYYAFPDRIRQDALAVTRGSG